MIYELITGQPLFGFLKGMRVLFFFVLIISQNLQKDFNIFLKYVLGLKDNAGLTVQMPTKIQELLSVPEINLLNTRNKTVNSQFQQHIYYLLILPTHAGGNLKYNPMYKYVKTYLNRHGDNSLNHHNTMKAFVKKTLNENPKLVEKIAHYQTGANIDTVNYTSSSEYKPNALHNYISVNTPVSKNDKYYNTDIISFNHEIKVFNKKNNGQSTPVSKNDNDYYKTNNITTLPNNYNNYELCYPESYPETTQLTVDCHSHYSTDTAIESQFFDKFAEINNKLNKRINTINNHRDITKLKDLALSIALSESISHVNSGVNMKKNVNMVFEIVHNKRRVAVTYCNEKIIKVVLNEIENECNEFMNREFPNLFFVKKNFKMYKAFMSNKLENLIMKRHVYFINDDLSRTL